MSDVEVVFERRGWALRDRVLILVWSGGASLSEVMERRARPWDGWLRRDTRGGARSIRVEVCYGGRRVVDCDVAESGEVRRFTRVHGGGRPSPDAFSLRHEARSPERAPIVRAAVVLAERAETEAEHLAGELFPRAGGELQPYPRVAEIHALRRALSG